MLPFDSNDPFPLLPPGQFSYAEEKQHSLEVDHWLGFEIDRIEDQLKNQVPKDVWADSWIGLAPETLQTPYTELRTLLKLLNPLPKTTVMDLGCAYGRMAHVLDRHFPDTHFIGMESVPARIEEAQRIAQRHQLEQSRWIQGNFSDPELQLPTADVLFIYDSSSTPFLEKLLRKLRSSEGQQVVVGRGRRIRDLIERGEPWLSQVHPPQHFKNFSVYRSRN